MSAIHNTLANDAVESHGPIWQTVANNGALMALTVAAIDVSQRKLVYQTDTGEVWMCLTTAPSFARIYPNAGAQPSGDVYMSTSRTTTSASFVDVTGATTTVTVAGSATYIWATAAIDWTIGVAAAHGWRLVIGAENGEEWVGAVAFGTGGQTTITMRSATALAAGTYTVKLQFRSTGGVQTLGTDHVRLTAIALEGAAGPGVGPTYSDAFTSSSATAAVVRNVPLSDDTVYTITVICTARDTGVLYYDKTSVTRWRRGSGGGATQIGGDMGPTGTDQITVTGLTVIANSNSVDVKYGGSGSVHTRGIADTYVTARSLAVAT